LWLGAYEGVERLWLRWRDKEGNWIPMPEEREEQERIQKEAALQRADLLAAKLRELGIDPNEIIGKK
jgi:hypothetical protein